MRKFLFLGMLMSSSVFADECEVTITSNDQMKFDQQVMSIPKSCSTFQVTLHHAGKLPKLVMGHNLVIVKKRISTQWRTTRWPLGLAMIT